jgi:acyl phosphate:glycerol-3-phosphate acyltransferase
MVINIVSALILAYLVGSIPSGLIVVRIANGKDVRQVGSGRTGGTNAMRAAGWLAGGLTGLLDVLKGVASGWLAGGLVPGTEWIKVVAALLAVLGHNYSLFLAQKDADGRWHLQGGAGGATALGGAIALWAPSWHYLLPLGVLIYLFIGYASLTTISMGFFSLVIFGYRWLSGQGNWIDIAYGVFVLGVVLWALRPNLERLRKGTERVVGLRAYFKKRFNSGSSGDSIS